VVLPDRVELPVLVVASASETGDAVGECVELPRDVPREDLDATGHGDGEHVEDEGVEVRGHAGALVDRPHGGLVVKAP
jgi:hypothetical protein